MRNSIRTRLTVAFIGLAIVPVLLVGVILAWQSFTTEKQQAFNLQREVARRVATEVAAFFKELENELHLVSKTQGLPGLDRDEQHNILQLLMTRNVFEDVVLLDSQGQEQTHLSRLGLFSTPHENYAEADEFVVPQAGNQVYYSPVRFEQTTGEPLITIAVPLLDIRTGLANGVLVSQVRLKKIWNLIADVRLSLGQSLYIVDAQNRVVAHQNPSVVLRDTRFVVPAQNGIQPGVNGKSTVLAIETLYFGEQVFHVVAEQTVSEALALAINTIVITAVLIVAALIIASSLGFLSVRQIVRPIHAMALTAEAISVGDLSQQVNVVSQDELGVLATAFNSMTTQLRKIITDLEGQIAERKRAEESLRETNETLHALFDFSPLAILMIDLESRVLLWNKAAERMYGWTAQEVVGKFLPNISEEKHEEHRAIRDRVTRGESLTRLELQRQRKDGSTFFLETSIAPLRDANGKVYAQMSIGADITERKQAEEALRESEQKFRAVAQNAQAVIFILDINGVFLLSEGQELVKLGLVPGQVVGTSVFELYKEYPAMLESITRALAGESVHVTNVVQDLAFDTVFSPYYNLEGEQIGIIGIAIDITERQRMEEALRESEFFLRKSQSMAKIGSYYFDARTGTWKSSPALDEIFGIDDTYPKNVEGWIGLIHLEHQEEMLRYLSQHVLAEHHRFDKEYQIIRHNDGRERWVHGLGELEFDDSGNTIKMIGTIQDITERKRAEAEIRQLNGELEARVKARTVELEFANRELKDFAYVVSHDLKAPLRAISRLASWLREDYAPAFDEKGHEMVDLLSGRVKRMDNLIDGILEYSRIGRIENPYVPVDLNQLVADVLDSLDPPEHIHIAVAQTLPTLIVEKTRIFQVFQNLIGNAIRFMDTPQGEIEIRCVEDDGYWRFSVADNGPGIDPKYHDRIFQIFQTLRPRDEFESTGIGLALVKKIVELHRGKIWLESTPGEGCQFFFTLPQ